MKSDLIDLELMLHHETEKAVLLSDTGKREDAKWVPKSQCELELKQGRIHIVTMSEWLAKEKEFI